MHNEIYVVPNSNGNLVKTLLLFNKFTVLIGKTLKHKSIKKINGGLERGHA
jgi:hypothetical protein